MARSSSILFGVLIAVSLAIAAPLVSKNKTQVAEGDALRAEWAYPEYLGRIPSIRTSLGSKFDDGEMLTGFQQVPVTYPGPTSAFFLELDGTVIGPDQLAPLFVGAYSLFDFTGHEDLENVGLVQVYAVPWPTDPTYTLDVVVITQIRDSVRSYYEANNDGGMVVDLDGLILQDAISATKRISGGTDFKGFTEVSTITYLRETKGDSDFVNGTFNVTADKFYEEQMSKYKRNPGVAGRDQREYNNLEKTIKIRYVIDLDVQGDDGAACLPYNHNSYTGVLFSEQEVTFDNYVPAYYFFPDRYVSSNYNEDDDDESILAVGFDVKGPRTGADRLFFASWESAFQNEYKSAEDDTGPDSEDNFIYKGIENDQEEYIGEGDIAGSFSQDDSAFIITFDGSNCWGPKGYPVIPKSFATFTVKFWPKFLEYIDEIEDEGDPSFEQCPYCSEVGKKRGPFDDSDNDEILDGIDRCPNGPVNDHGERCDRIQFDIDQDWYPDACDYCPVQFDEDCNQDVDGDGLGDNCDNCPEDANDHQIDWDNDGYGNVCDNCPDEANEEQEDWDQDNVGDICDNCFWTKNPNQSDHDNDGRGDACDNCVNEANWDQSDVDHDFVGDVCDNCVNEANEGQEDSDKDGLGDACDNCAHVANWDQDDSDVDGRGDVCDNCPEDKNWDQADDDLDGFGDVCDHCRNFYSLNNSDTDKDGRGDVCDNCPTDVNPDQEDRDLDTIGDVCDNCADEANQGQEDYDEDSVGDICDNCPWTPNWDQINSDTDYLGDACDNCPMEANEGQEDEDHDNVGDVCDLCPGISTSNNTDFDGDKVGDYCDYCPHSFPEFRNAKWPIDGEPISNIQIHPGCFVSDYDLKIENGAQLEDPVPILNTHQRQHL